MPDEPKMPPVGGPTPKATTQPAAPSALGALIARVAAGIAPQVRAFAKEAGSSCNLPECDAITIGTRCSGCSRRLCVSHTLWRSVGVTFTPLCPYCVSLVFADLFDDEDA